MFTIYDYIKYYKDITLDRVSWNIMDNLICSIISYIPIESFNRIKNMLDFYNYSIKYKDIKTFSVMSPISFEILNLIYKSKRYESLKICDVVNTKTELTQFGAFTFRINNNTIVSFKGTDGSMIGWIENFRLGYKYPTNTHLLAINYLNETIKLNDRNIYVVGHSKGGNLAMVSALESTNSIFKRIIDINNFDGPGFLKEIYESDKYKKISNKLINIIPSSSVVGTLLYNDNYKVIKSSNISIQEHNPVSWNMFGECFIESKLTSISNKIHESTLELNNISYDKLESTFESIFNDIDNKKDKKFSLEEFIKIYKNKRNIDLNISNKIDNIINSISLFKK